MNSMKTLFMAAMLVAVLYGVYVAINRNPEATYSDADQDYGDMLTIDPGTGSPTAPDAGMAPAFSAGAAPAATTAPPFTQALSSLTPTASTEPPSVAPSYPPNSPRVLAAPPAAQSEVAGAPASGGSGDLASLMNRVNEELAAGHLVEAHLMLSQCHSNPALPPDQAQQVVQLLDQLAGTVIYSREHLLEQPYTVKPTDTLEQIAQQYNVPAGLLAKINGLDPRAPLRPGQELKVLRGPFDATIDLNNHELTLTLGGQRYAGRFSIGVGPQLRQDHGTFLVTDKTDTSAFPAGQNKTLGTRWIGLGSDMGIHGAAQPQPGGQNVNQGCISLGRRDIEDLYDILSIGSKVTLRR